MLKLLAMKKYFVAFIFCIQCLMIQAKDYPASLFGISSDGVTLNTRSIQFAIDYIHQQEAAVYVFNAGRFLTGSIQLKSNVTIHLLEGAVLSGTLNPFDYDREGFTALILCHDQENIGITGVGVIDGRGERGSSKCCCTCSSRDLSKTPSLRQARSAYQAGAYLFP
jgi:polygalacturonase